MTLTALLFEIPEWVPYLAGVLAVVGVIAAILYLLDRKRTQAMTTFALENGFTFCAKDWTKASNKPNLVTPLFNRGRGRQFYNIMTGTAGGFPICLFDYSYTVGGGKSQHTYLQTVAAFTKNGAILPEFDLHNEGLLEKIGDAIVHKDIHFDSHPGFSKIYRLRGPDGDKIRFVFTPSLLSFLEGVDAKKKWRLEGVNDTLIVFRQAKRVKPVDVRTFLEETSAIAGQFFALCGATK